MRESHGAGQAAPASRTSAHDPTSWRTGMPVEKSSEFWPSAHRLLTRLRQEPIRLIAAAIFAILGVALSILAPTLIGRATDIIFSGVIGENLTKGTTEQQAVAAAAARGNVHLAAMFAHMHFVPGSGIDFRMLSLTLSEVVAAYALSNLLLWAQAYLLNDLVQAVVIQLRSDVEEKIHCLPLCYFDTQPRGEFLSRVSNDVSNISQTLQQSLTQLSTALPTVLGVVAMMFFISPPLALIALATIPLSILLTKLLAKRSQRYFVAQWALAGDLSSHIDEAFSGHDLLRLFDRQPETVRRFEAMSEQLSAASFGAQFVSSVIILTVMSIGNLNYVLIAVVGGLHVATGGMTLGAVQAFIQYSLRFSGPVTQVASIATVLQSAVASAERVFDLLNEPEQTAEPETPVRPASLRGRVEFHDVSFRHREDKPLIEDLSLIAEPGHTVAIVGPTGAGKTTLVNLLLRFYELQHGRILLDGIDTAKMRRHELRSRIGMVLQDPWLFKGSIRDNIRFGQPAATDEEVLAASKATFVDQFVRSLPDGYDTIVDGESSNISTGQKQLITVARALLTRPTVLVFDEATSSVDTLTETHVQLAMAALRANRTSFVIAHRLSTIRDADLILVMRDGRIVEQGTHDALLAREGDYYGLHLAQFGDAQIGDKRRRQPATSI